MSKRLSKGKTLQKTDIPIVDKYNKKKKPKMLPVQAASIPKNLKKIPNWLNWRWEKTKKRDGSFNKWSKPPINGTSTNSNLTFKEAFQNHKDNPDLGVGFSIHNNDVCGIDGDNVLESKKVKSGRKTRIKKEYAELFEDFKDVYVEISPSGEGIRIFGFGDPKTLGSRKGCPIEIYNKGRYLTVTGHTLNGCAGTPLVKIQKKTNKLYDKVFEQFLGGKNSKGRAGGTGKKKRWQIPGRNEKRLDTHSNENYLKVTQMLGVFDSTNYDTWLKVGMAIHHETRGKKFGLKTWVGWSEGNDEGEGGCHEKWGTFGGSEKPFTVRSLRREYDKAIRKKYEGETYFEDQEEGVEYLNTKYAVCNLKNKVRILKFENESFLTKTDFTLDAAKYSTDSENGKYEVQLATIWLKSPNRKEFNSIEFNPKLSDKIAEKKKVYNLYQPPVFLPPKKTDSWDLLKEHLFTVICGGDKKLFAYMMQWAACCVQRPGHKIGVSIVLRGGRGAGKGKFVDWFGKLFGNYYIAVTNSGQVTGKFNALISKCLLVFANEAFFAGDQSGGETLKGLITDEDSVIEMKGVDSIKGKSYTNLIMASNKEWVVPAGYKDERRFLILDVADKWIIDLEKVGEKKKRKKNEYFRAIDEEMKNGGLEAMYHELASYGKDKSVDLRIPPYTEALREQSQYSQDSIITFWQDVYNHFETYTERQTTIKDSQGKNRFGLFKSDWFVVHYPDFCKRVGLNGFRQEPNVVAFWKKTYQYFPEMKSFSCFQNGGRHKTHLKVLKSILKKRLK